MNRRRMLHLVSGSASALALPSVLPNVFHNALRELPSTSDEIAELDRQLNAYIIAHNAAEAAKLYDEDFMLTVSGGGVKRKADMLADIRNPAVVLSVCETSDVQVRVRGSTAVLTGALRQAGTVNGRAIDVTLRVTDTWTKVNGTWLLFAGHASVAQT